MKPEKTLTKAQISAYWRAAAAAARHLGEPMEKYRKRVMLEECDAESMRVLNRTSDFDKVMRRFAIDADDYDTALKYTGGDDRRLAEIVRDCAVQVLMLAGKQSDPGLYVRGILQQSLILAKVSVSLFSGITGIELDIDSASIRKVFQMLDTHRRRLLRRAGYSGILSFEMGSRKRIVHGRVVDADASAPRLDVTVRLFAA